MDRPSGMTRAGAALAAVAATTWVALAPSQPAAADVIEPLALTYDAAIYGDYLHIGNAVVDCPPGGGSGFTSVPCSDGLNRTNMNALNDYYNMTWIDPGDSGASFNGSTGELTIPPAASVAYAQLSWAGNTGVLRSSGGTLRGPDTGDQACGSYQQSSGSPATIPPGDPQSQELTVSVDGGGPVTVAPAEFVSEGLPGNGAAQYYSAHADVTALFADAPTGSPVDVFVGDVWTPEGYNCFGGWSLTLVYAYPQPDATHAPHLRHVYVYTGHVRQNPGEAPADTLIEGFSYAGGDIRLGITAYEGDWGITGDFFEMNGTQLDEPQIGGDSNYFISATDGSVSPDHPNNFSVDAKSESIPESAGLIQVDDTSADLAFGTTGDAYLAQLLVFSVPVPELRVSKEVCDSPDAGDCGPDGPGPWQPSTELPLGDTAYWRITVTNPDGVDISGVTLQDDVEPSCAQAAGTFDVPAGETRVFYCHTDDITEATTNSVTSSFVPDGTPPGTPPTVSPPAEAHALPYGMSVVKQVCASRTAADCGPDGDGPWVQRGTVQTGETAYWRITAINTGAVTLTDVTVEDEVEPACEAAAGTFELPAGQTRHVYCQTENLTEGLANVAVVEAPAPPEAPAGSPPVREVSEPATAEPPRPLPDTGTSPVLLIASAGLGLLAAGGAMVSLAWRRGWRVLSRRR